MSVRAVETSLDLTTPALEILSQVYPAVHGLYRAISSTSFNWTVEHWNTVAQQLQKLCSPSLIERLNRLLIDILQKEDPDEQQWAFAQTFLGRYVAQGRPLNGYFMICCILEMEWTILAQTMITPVTGRTTVTEAAASNKAWSALSKTAALILDIDDEDIKKNIKQTIAYAMGCFTDLLTQMEEMETEPSADTYAWETLSESLASGAFSEA
mgnify:CR=1 FL=1